MKFFIDTANLSQIQEAQDLGVLDGVTTNPSLMAKEGITGKEAILKHYTDICTIVEGDVSAEVIATDFEGIVREGEELAALHPQIVVKVPMIKDGIKASFVLGGITNAMVELLEEGLVEKVIDVQDFDHPSAVSLGRNADHYEIDASMYANPLSKGAMVNRLDVAILSALEVDTDFNVNVMTGSDGVIRGASGGHCDTAFAAKMSLVISPLVRGRIPTFVDKVNTVITPGTSVDVVVTEVGIAINPNRPDLIEYFKDLKVPQLTIEELKEKAYAIVGNPQPIQYGDKIVALIEYRDGSLIDVVRNV